MNKLKMVSLVPSWTETLFEAGGNVIGCTRFCLHPEEAVKNCLKIGGTKDLDLKKLMSLNPDYVIMDKEENTREMVSCCPFKILPSHVRSLEDLKMELKHFSSILELPLLEEYANRVEKILSFKSDTSFFKSSIPDTLDRWTEKVPENFSGYSLVYIIWNKPFMCVTKETYIGSVLSSLGFKDQLWAPEGRGLYPEFALSELPAKSLLLFSSEPYPFARFKSDYLKLNLPHPAVLVDGESYSWFGIRNLRFLERELF